MNKVSDLRIRLVSACIALHIASPVLAIEPTEVVIPQEGKWFFDYSAFNPSIEVPVIDKPETIKLPISKMKLRAKKSQEDDRVEPFAFALKRDDEHISAIARKFAKEGKEESLSNYLRSNIDNSEVVKPGSDSRNVYLTRKAFQLINEEKFGTRFENVHHSLSIKIKELQRDPALLAELLRQAEPYLAGPDQARVKSKVGYGLDIEVDQDFLPAFAKKMVKKFTIYRGPNCFHAALAFQDTQFTDSLRYNVKREPGYHRAMINYDELWRVLRSDFYEVDISKASLKYGDIITFFEVPNGNPGAIDFRWIRHTASYLFNGYTFSKGSKSPNTPYSVKTLKEEWDTWKSYVDKMAVKVFRKSGKSVKSAPASDLTDWLY